MPEYRYKNPWHNPASSFSKPEFVCHSHPINYMGYQIFHRGKSKSYPIFDVLKEGACVTQRNSLNAAMNFIDREIDNPRQLSQPAP